VEEEGWLGNILTLEERGDPRGLTFPPRTVNKYDGSLRLCVLLFGFRPRPPPSSPLCHLFHLELLKMFDRISVDSQQGCKPEPRHWVSVRENLILARFFSPRLFHNYLQYTDGCFTSTFR